jgi:hypothetical protein
MPDRGVDVDGHAQETPFEAKAELRADALERPRGARGGFSLRDAYQLHT